MIRYRLPADIAGMEPFDACSCNHARLRHLAHAGPWTANRPVGGLTLTQVVPGHTVPDDGWGPWQEGSDGFTYQTAVDLPPLSALARPVRDRSLLVEINHSQGRLWVLPAIRSPRRFNMDGSIAGYASAYAEAAFRLHATLEAREDGGASAALPMTEVLAVCRMTLATGYRLTDEACHAYGLLTDSDCGPILAGAWAGPKAEPAAGS
jgi:hypothetical protein